MKKALRTGNKIKTSHGFTLIELMVAMTIFLIIGAAAMSLFKQHASLFTTQQGEVGLNMGLRNALQQIQTDAVQAGNGFYNGGATQTSNTPAGVSVQNAAGSYDTVFFIQAATPAIHSMVLAASRRPREAQLSPRALAYPHPSSPATSCS